MKIIDNSTAADPEARTHAVMAYVEVISRYGPQSTQARELRARLEGVPGFIPLAEACDSLGALSSNRRIAFQPSGLRAGPQAKL